MKYRRQEAKDYARQNLRGIWAATLTRIRSEFEEMPCMRVTLEQARTLFGLSHRVADWILTRLTAEGFLSLNEQGEFIRRQATP